jgi:two-component system, chemotaxis family, sensor kinase CheA
MSQPDDFITEFLIESREGLDQLDSDLVALEADPRETDRFDSAFRVLHTIKGNAGFLDFPKLGDLAHAGETLLSRLKSGERQVDSQVIDTLLKLLDTIRRILVTIELTGSEGDESFDKLADALKRMVVSESIVESPGPTDSTPGSPEEKVSPDDSGASLPALPNSDPWEATAAFSREEHEQSLADEFQEETALGERDTAATKDAPDEQSGSPTPVPPEASAPTEVKKPRRKGANPKKPTARTKKKVAAAPDADVPTPAEDVPEPVPSTAAPAKTVPATSAAASETPQKKRTDEDSEPGDKSDSPSDSSQPVKVPAAGSASSNLVRVDVELLDRLMNLVGELVLARNQIVQILSNRTDPELLNPIQRLNLLTTELQEGVLKTRMQQIGSIWQRYPRMVRDFAKMCGKEVELQLSGAETELDKSLVESITDPLVHLIRNAIDHGIEKPYIRKVKKKPRTGLLTLKASHEGGQVLIEITDDGSGLDINRIRKKAIERGLITESDANQLDERDIHDFIFMPGFSTADQVDSVSGRGVGMDVVKTHIERVGGTIEIDTEKDVGTTFRLTVPLTLAIIPALIVTGGGQRFAVPQTNVMEMLTLHDGSGRTIEYFHDTPVLRLRGDVLPVVSLNEQLQIGDGLDPTKSASIMVLKTGTRQFALIVDTIGNSEEIVVKPFGQVLEGMSEYGGATIMGDGSVALILDVRGIAQRAGLFATDRSLLQAAAHITSDESDVIVDDALLVADLSDQQRVAWPLADVVRLEEIPAFQIEVSSGREVIQYRGEILPMLRLRELLSTQETTAGTVADPDMLSVVIHQSAGRTVGLIVQRVVDIAADPEQVRPAAQPGPILGTVVTLGRVTDLVDVPQLIELAGLPASTTQDQT